MIEVTIYGRGGQGGVTLAKLLGQAYFRRGQHSQAFGVYAAERSGAPIQAFVRVDDEEITNHNQIREPDHVIVLDRTLIAPTVSTGLKPQGWLILNTPQRPDEFTEMFGGCQMATVDATAIAVTHNLGTRTVPIVNTTMFGAVARVLGLSFEDVAGTLEALRFVGPNLAAAREAFDRVTLERLPGIMVRRRPTAAPADSVSLFDDRVGSPPAIHTGTWATRRPHRRRLTPPCNHACPAGNDVQAFVAAAAKEEYDKALAILLETSPLPGVCGRVCPAPCMDACQRSAFDASVNVRDLERYVADHAARKNFDVHPWRAQHVAVVGSGPAGLSAAYHLARLGYQVTMFESADELGGVMRTGIPEYRLPRAVLDREIDFILDQGVEARTAHRVDREQLVYLTHEYAAVFVGTGLQEARSLDLGPTLGGSTERVMQGLDFLDRVRMGTISIEGEQVLVIGGGNTAIDAARSARRLGAVSVRIVYRRSRGEMPAISEEIAAAEEEGVFIDELVSPVRLQLRSGTLYLTFQRMRLGEADETGRPRPVPETSEDAYFDLRCDRVILALGQTPDVSILPEGAQVHRGDALLGLTGAPVFCGGDFASNDGTVSAAIGSGHRAALHIHRMLCGEDLLTTKEEPLAGPADIRTYMFAHAPRQPTTTIDPTQRRRTFVEVHQGLGECGKESAAALEAQRCFSCGVCNECDRCVTYCPEGILVHEDSGYRFDYDYCKGCGVCASQCPRGVIYMAEL